MSRGTAYKNILLIKSVGELLELGVPEGSKGYDANRPYPHQHVMGIKCHKIVDTDLDSLDEIKKEVALERPILIFLIAGWAFSAYATLVCQEKCNIFSLLIDNHY